MQDYRAKLGRLLHEAEDCDVVSAHASDPTKRAVFSYLAMQLRTLATGVQQTIASNSKGRGG
jgi:hypothetical protein